jgi:hypothetical protein
VPELIEDGVSGFIVESVEGTAAAVERVPSLRRDDCRQAFLDRSTASRMAEDYLGLYRRLLDGAERSYSRGSDCGLRRSREALDDVIRLQDQFYILVTSSRIDDRTRVPKDGVPHGVRRLDLGARSRLRGYPRPPYPEDGAIQLLRGSRDLKIVSVR